MATLNSHQVTIMLRRALVGYIPANAITMNIALSKSCDQRFDKKDLNQNIFSPIIPLTKKNVNTSWYSAIINAVSDARAMRPEVPKIRLYASLAHSPFADQGIAIDNME